MAPALNLLILILFFLFGGSLQGYTKSILKYKKKSRCVFLKSHIQLGGNAASNDSPHPSKATLLKFEDDEAKQFRKLGKKINVYVERLQKLGYPIKKEYIYSPALADKKVREMEYYLHIEPEFRQKTHGLIAKHKLLKSQTQVTKEENYDEDMSDENNNSQESEIEKKAEETLNSFVKDSGFPTNNNVVNPVDIVNEHVNALEEIINDAVSTATGIDDYMGLKASRAKKAALAQEELALSMGLSPETAMYLSGETKTKIPQDMTNSANII